MRCRTHVARSRYAQATIVASLVMVLSSVLFSSILLAWAYGSLGQGQTNLSQAIFRVNTQANELFVIEEVNFDFTVKPNRVLIYVRNAGDVPVRIAGVHITNAVTGAGLFSCELKDTALKTILPRSSDLLPAISKPPPTGVTCSGSQPTGFGVGETWRIRLGSLGGNQFEANFRVQQ